MCKDLMKPQTFPLNHYGIEFDYTRELKFDPYLKPANVPIVDTLEDLQLYIGSKIGEGNKVSEESSEEYDPMKPNINEDEYPAEDYHLVENHVEGSVNADNELVITLKHVSNIFKNSFVFL